MPIDHFLLPKIAPLLAGNNLETVRELHERKFSGIRAGAQPDDRVVLTIVDEALRGKIKVGGFRKMDSQECAVLYAKVVVQNQSPI